MVGRGSVRAAACGYVRTHDDAESLVGVVLPFWPRRAGKPRLGVESLDDQPHVQLALSLSKNACVPVSKVEAFHSSLSGFVALWMGFKADILYSSLLVPLC